MQLNADLLRPSGKNFRAICFSTQTHTNTQFLISSDQLPIGVLLDNHKKNVFSQFKFNMRNK